MSLEKQEFTQIMCQILLNNIILKCIELETWMSENPICMISAAPSVLWGTPLCIRKINEPTWFIKKHLLGLAIQTFIYIVDLFEILSLNR